MLKSRIMIRSSGPSPKRRYTAYSPSLEALTPSSSEKITSSLYSPVRVNSALLDWRKASRPSTAASVAKTITPPVP